MDFNNIEYSNAEVQVDWKKIKEILCGVAESLKLVCSLLPAGNIKNIICGLAGILHLICEKLP